VLSGLTLNERRRQLRVLMEHRPSTSVGSAAFTRAHARWVCTCEREWPTRSALEQHTSFCPQWVALPDAGVRLPDLDEALRRSLVDADALEAAAVDTLASAGTVAGAEELAQRPGGRRLDGGGGDADADDDDDDAPTSRKRAKPALSRNHGRNGLRGMNERAQRAIQEITPLPVRDGALVCGGGAVRVMAVSNDALIDASAGARSLMMARLASLFEAKVFFCCALVCACVAGHLTLARTVAHNADCVCAQCAFSAGTHRRATCRRAPAHR
jgi:hypothetical protein